LTRKDEEDHHVAETESRTTTLELNASEAATVRQALQVLLDALSREEADQIDEIQAILQRLPAAS
jgi:hypothetical protein